MKSTMILAFCLLFVSCCFAQKRTYEDYMRKSRKRTVGAWVFMGTGAAITAGGIALLSGYSNEARDYYDTDPELILDVATVTTGVILMGASIPFFIMSHRYKKKAMNLAFKAEKIQLPGLGKFTRHLYPALSLKLNIGR
ncbi:MAG: hypothetical protein JST09_15860 [Bacteroidetes bacterium]|nr:hypothetical protein [Bacteroidota bacterium]